jgi:hypothetical protein
MLDVERMVIERSKRRNNDRDRLALEPVLAGRR